MKIELASADETEAFGAALWQALPESCLIFLHGELGAGKTTLVRGALRAAGFLGAVKSPTYNLVEEYQQDGHTLFHFDLYRLQDAEELEWIGIDDYFQQPARCFIEWPEMGEGFLPQHDIDIKFKIIDGARQLELEIIPEELKKTLHLLWKNKDILL